MFCPVCSQEQVSEETRFCSRCGFLLTGVSHLIASGGALPHMAAGSDPNAISPRKKGVKQGALLLFLSFIVVPLVAIITLTLGGGPEPVAAAAILLGGGGILRMIYAFLFESGAPILKDEGVLPEVLKKVLPDKKTSSAALPPSQSVPASSYVPPSTGNWRETNDLAAPPSVTDSTTKLLQKEE